MLAGKGLNGIIHADGHGDVPGPEVACRDKPQQVTGEEAHPAALHGKEERAVAVAVGGDHGIDVRAAVGVHQGLDALQHFRVDRLGVHRDELVASSRGRDRGAHVGQGVHQQVAAHRGVLPDQDPAA